AEEIPADRVIHTKIDVDSTEKRGRSRLASCRIPVCLLRGTIRNEVYLRNAQSSIVLVRKVAGGSGTVNRVTDNAKTSVTEYREGSINREKFRPGTVLTVSKGMEVSFSQPDSNFSDASPLIKLLIQQICAATGWSYTMVSSDSSDQNASAGVVAESPVAQMVKNERVFIQAALSNLFKWVFETWVAQQQIEGVTPESLWAEWMLDMSFDPVVTREPLKEAQCVNLGIMTKTISIREGSRRMGADPDQMRAEVEEESKNPSYMGMQNNVGAMNPTQGDKQASSAANAQGGSGTNQGGPA
ncbi:MAG: phage portal protein, partial [Desulfurellales bacterium]